MKEFIVKGKKCFDGKKVRQNFYFVVKDQLIIEMGEQKDLQEQDREVIDFKDRLVIPGMMDAHVHVCMDPMNGKAQMNMVEATLQAQKNLFSLLHNGITYVRDVGAPAGIMQTLKQQIEHGSLCGPDMKICGQAICARGGHGWQMSKESDCVDDIRRFVRENVKEDVDQIKLMVTGGINTKGDEMAPIELTREEIAAAVEEAHKRGRKVAVHTHGRTGIETCLQCGVDSIEHGLLMDEELANIAKEQGTWVVPTLSAPYFAATAGLAENPHSKSHLKSKQVMEIHRKNIIRAHKMGVKMAMGTDCGTPYNTFESVLQELVLLKDIGIEAEEVLRMATSRAAELLEVNDIAGTLEVGKQATFVVFEKDPLVNMQEVLHIHCVYKKGKSI